MANDFDHSQMNETPQQEGIIRIPPWLKKRTRLERILCIISVTSLLTVAVMAAILAYFGYVNNKNMVNNSFSPNRVNSSPSKISVSNLCLTPGCVKAAGALLSSLDENINPCNDFYRFVCGEWLKKKTIPDEKSYLSVYHEAEDNLNMQLKNLLEKKLNGTEPSFITMTKKFYDSCMDLKSIEEAGAKPLKDILKRLGGWPVVEGTKWDESKFDWVETSITLRNLGLNYNILLTLLVTVDYRYNSKHILELEEPLLGMPDRTYLLQGLNDSSTKAYYDFMVKAATLLGANEAAAEKELFDALSFEIALANYSLSREERRNVSEFYNKYTIRKLQEKIPQIPWLKYISGLSTDVIYENETLNVATPQYVQKFADLIAKTDKRVIANYVMWRVVAESLPFLSKDWREINLEYEKVLIGKSRETPRFEKCMPSLEGNLGIALSSYYIQHYFKDEIKNEVLKIVKYVHKEFLRILEEIDWMDEKTKTYAKAKANNMLFYVGYPEELINKTAVMKFYQNLNISSDSYFENILQFYKWTADYDFSMLRKPNNRKDWTKRGNVAVVNAVYDYSSNIVELPAGYLQNPFYNKDRPNYMNFAFIGSTIGHEITHGFDDEGRQFDKDGNNVNWWDKSTDEHFRKKAQCIIDQYSNYTAENGMKLNGIITQGENIADNGALKESYWAYQSWVKDHGEEKLLPGLNYNQNQLFWISASYEYCSKYRPEELKYSILSDPHSIDEFRVIGPLSNLKEFANDFNCPATSPMNKRHKCQVW